MKIRRQLYSDIADGGWTLSAILRQQQAYHEWRRWSVYDVVSDRRIESPTDADRAALWHAARAELTTQPAGIRMAVDGVRLARELERENPAGAMVLHAAAAWSARYWLEEEAHHEVAYGLLLEMAGGEPIAQEEVIRHRGFFPEDNYARVCILQACVEIEACVTYGEMGKVAQDPLVREIFWRIMRDEVQHRAYFISFAKALVQAGVYPAKDVLAMAFTWLRPGGESYGSTRARQTSREGFVNWWENTNIGDNGGLALAHDRVFGAHLQRKKERSVFKAVREATGIVVNSVAELQKAYMRSLVTDADRLRPAVAH